MKMIEKLESRFCAEIAAWDWGKIETECQENLHIENDEVVGSVYLGSVLAMFPSGKIYAPWTTNQSGKDVIRDQAYMSALESVADALGFYIVIESGDVFAMQCLDFEGYFTTEDGNTFFRDGESFGSIDEVVAEMVREQFFPGVYWVSDHGNVSAYKMDAGKEKAYYLHPVSGDVQTWAEWVDDSADWEGDIEQQLASLIEVVKSGEGWVEGEA